MKKTIEIFVACHKPSELPKNDLFKPIHVGSKNSKIVLQGLLRDDVGDNISEKNPQYCEMTAQYWAWKHSTANYIGLCHYRRYLNFSDTNFTNFTPDNRKQVLVKVLTPETEKKYGLLDKEQMQKVIESNDILVANAQDLSKVNTPYGPQKSTLEHWKAHDMALINYKDFLKLAEIVKEKYPEIFIYMNKYMNGKYFYGFNTFVMRRDLFCEMCEFEFDVLSELEKAVDISNYNQQLSRIYGFMGEILFSTFVYYVQQTRKNINIKECQMLYFDKTDPIENIQPQFNESINVVFDVSQVPAFLLYPSLITFLKNISTENNYEIIVLTKKVHKYYATYFKSLIEKYSNVKIIFKDVDFFDNYLQEMYGNVGSIPSCFLPWILPNFDRCIYLKWNTIINRNIDDLFTTDLGDNYIAAARDIYYEGKLNTFYTDDWEFAHTIGIENKFKVVNDSVLVMDLKKLRTNSLADLSNTFARINESKQRIMTEDEQFNLMYQGKTCFLGQEYNCLINSGHDIDFYIKEASLNLNKAYQASQKLASIQRFDFNAPWFLEDNPEFYLRYWEIVKASKLEPIFQNHLIRRNNGERSTKDYMWDFVNTVLPKHSKRREVVKSIFPRRGKIYRSLKKMVNQ